MKDATVLSLAGIIALLIIEISCLFYGIDHIVVASITALVAGLAGYEMRKRREPESA